jgi:amidohydrolase
MSAASAALACGTCLPGEVCDCFGGLASAMAAARLATGDGAAAAKMKRTSPYTVLPCIAEPAAHAWMVELRRWFHMHPELSYQVKLGSAMITLFYRALCTGSPPLACSLLKFCIHAYSFALLGLVAPSRRGASARARTIHGTSTATLTSHHPSFLVSFLVCVCVCVCVFLNQEAQTANRIVQELRGISGAFRISEGVDGTHGIIADLDIGGAQGGGAGNAATMTIMLRADMDALPIQEAGSAAYKSQNDGVMHACGHDAHLAILLATARALARPDVNASMQPGLVRFVFQPAEEGGAGAKRMIAGGCLDGVDRVFGLHVWNFMDAGTIGIREGPITANSDRIYIDITGAGGHGSMPQGTVDAVLVAAHLVVALHSGVVSRACDPFDAVCLTVGKITGGRVANAIAGSARLDGTVRTRTAAVQQMVMEKIQQICAGVALTFGATIDCEYRKGYPATVSSRRGALDVQVAAAKIVGEAAVLPPHPTLAGEDMAYYLDGSFDGAFFFVGSSPVSLRDGQAGVPHHRFDFDVDERCLEVGASVMVQVCKDVLGSSMKDDGAASSTKASPAVVVVEDIAP